jgi:hypothetical protein
VTASQVDENVRTSQQRTSSKKKKLQQPSQTDDINRTEVQTHLKLLRQFREESLIEFKT